MATKRWTSYTAGTLLPVVCPNGSSVLRALEGVVIMRKNRATCSNAPLTITAVTKFIRTTATTKITGMKYKAMEGSCANRVEASGDPAPERDPT
eukprot:2247905-Amphidinium_carterae.1